MLDNLVAVSGGIGSGKSIVCRILEIMGYPVYDCDSRARSLIDSDSTIKERIAGEVCREAVDSCGNIDRGCLGARVFADRGALARLNEITHGAVRADLEAWYLCHRSTFQGALFVETAIPYSSRIDEMVESIWMVDAPVEIRLARVLKRNPLLSERDIMKRIKAQQPELAPELPHQSIHFIVNDGLSPVIPRILSLLGETQSRRRKTKE